ncbi:hypothetical protein [Agarilytica rhodophyticola]|uniref:hypothetical protein n=1 Tax=Agarilytica rhodophyticola TaxID=1737490 RepID=UPI000B341C8B|nr:hypothetical protein [Agarilytica rhodophyticola]
MGEIKINSSVGKKAKNQAIDVKKVYALINVYLRAQQKSSFDISEENSEALEAAIAVFQKDYVRLSNPDSLISPNGKTIKKLNEVLENTFKPLDITKPDFGQVTWDSEGTEGGRFHSRKLHVPSSASGLTIGRGYDLRRKTQNTIQADMTKAAIDSEIINILKEAAGLSGATATQFIIDNDLLDFQISNTAQKALFKISYDFEASEVKRISEKADVVKIYGKTDWHKLNNKIRDIAVDLKFRGDYTPLARRKIQKSIADNNLLDFKKEIIDQKNWPDVPADRFSRRVKFLS